MRITILGVLGGIAVVGVLAGAPGVAHADPAKDPALELFEQGEAAYRAGHFQESIDKLLAAKKLRQEAVLDYDLGRAYEALGKQREAADAYETYLREDPNARDRGAIEGRVATLRAQADAIDKAKTPPPSPPPAPPPPVIAPEEPKRSLVPPIIVTSVGVVGIGAASILGVLAKNKHDDATAEPSQVRARDMQDSAESLARGSTITFIAGGVVLAAGLVWLGYELFSKPDGARASLPRFVGTF